MQFQERHLLQKHNAERFGAVRMTALATSIKLRGLFAPLVQSRGVGQDASLVKNRIEEVREHLLEPLTLRQAWVELEEVAKEAAALNWDGYGARAIDPGAYQEAKRFLNALPTLTPVPEASVDPDGEVAISWHIDSDWVFSVSIGPEGRLSYAGLFGKSKAYGTEWFSDEVPEAILDNIARLFSSHAA